MQSGIHRGIESDFFHPQSDKQIIVSQSWNLFVDRRSSVWGTKQKHTAVIQIQFQINLHVRNQTFACSEHRDVGFDKGMIRFAE